MVECIALSRISTRDNGERVVFQKGNTFITSLAEAERLVKLKVAKIQNEVEEEKVVYLSDTELSKKNKEWLEDYGGKLGLQLSVTMKKDEMVSLILDAIEELKAEDGNS